MWWHVLQSLLTRMMATGRLFHFRLQELSDGICDAANSYSGQMVLSRRRKSHSLHWSVRFHGSVYVSLVPDVFQCNFDDDTLVHSRHIHLAAKHGHDHYALYSQHLHSLDTQA